MIQIVHNDQSNDSAYWNPFNMTVPYIQFSKTFKDTLAWFTLIHRKTLKILIKERSTYIDWIELFVFKKLQINTVIIVLKFTVKMNSKDSRQNK